MAISGFQNNSHPKLTGVTSPKSGVTVTFGHALVANVYLVML